MEKLKEGSHDFKGYGIHDSKINYHIYQTDDAKVVVLIDLGKGTSVTNAAEQLATELTVAENLNHKEVKWMELYPYYNHSAAWIDFKYDEMSEEYSSPDWTPVPESDKLLYLLKQTITHEEEPEGEHSDK